jgi:hypothetical protein
VENINDAIVMFIIPQRSYADSSPSPMDLIAYINLISISFSLFVVTLEVIVWARKLHLGHVIFK